MNKVTKRTKLKKFNDFTLKIEYTAPHGEDEEELRIFLEDMDITLCMVNGKHFSLNNLLKEIVYMFVDCYEY